MLAIRSKLSIALSPNRQFISYRAGLQVLVLPSGNPHLGIPQQQPKSLPTQPRGGGQLTLSPQSMQRTGGGPRSTLPMSGGTQGTGRGQHVAQSGIGLSGALTIVMQESVVSPQPIIRATLTIRPDHAASLGLLYRLTVLPRCLQPAWLLRFSFAL